MVCNIQDLDLSSNNIGNAGMQALSTALAGGAMAHLELLYLENIPVSEQTEQTMKIATANRNTILTIFMSVVWTSWKLPIERIRY